MLRAVAASPWTDEDRALLIALGRYEATLCTRCGHPRDTAWHPDNDGYFEVTVEITCHACTALDNYDVDGKHNPTKYLTITDVRDYTADPLPPLRLAPVGSSTKPPPPTGDGGDSTLGG